MRCVPCRPPRPAWRRCPTTSSVDRRSARAGARQSAQLPARLARRDRSAARHRSATPTTVYERARQQLRRRCARRAPLVVEESPSLYVYRLRWARTCRPAWPAASRWTSTTTSVIKKHEHTRVGQGRRPHPALIELRAQTGPVFLTYRSRRRRSTTWWRASPTSAPLFDFDGGRRRAAHGLARGRRAGAARSSPAFAAVPALYIADGHHRAASAARARRHCRRPTGEPGEWDTFLAVAFPDAQMQVLPYNRVVKDLGGHDAGVVLARAARAAAPSPPGGRRAGAARRRVDVSRRVAGTTVELPAASPASHAARRAARRQPAADARPRARCSASATRAPTRASTSWAAAAARRSSSVASRSGERRGGVLDVPGRRATS